MGDFVARNSRWRLTLLFLGAVGFVAIGLWMGGAFGAPPGSARYPDAVVFAVGWLGVMFFGLCAIAALGRLFGPSEQLKIDRSGVRYKGWSGELIPWSEIVDVTTWSGKGQKAMILHLRDRARFPGRGLSAMLARANRMFTGGDIFISLAGTDRSFDEAMSAIERFRTPGRPSNGAWVSRESPPQAGL